MFDKSSDYAVNKRDPDAIVCQGSIVKYTNTLLPSQKWRGQ